MINPPHLPMQEECLYLYDHQTASEAPVHNVAAHGDFAETSSGTSPDGIPMLRPVLFFAPVLFRHILF